jgi:hypothetical protein
MNFISIEKICIALDPLFRQGFKFNIFFSTSLPPIPAHKQMFCAKIGSNNHMTLRVNLGVFICFSLLYLPINTVEIYRANYICKIFSVAL